MRESYDGLFEYAIHCLHIHVSTVNSLEEKTYRNNQPTNQPEFVLYRKQNVS